MSPLLCPPNTIVPRRQRTYTEHQLAIRLEVKIGLLLGLGLCGSGPLAETGKCRDEAPPLCRESALLSILCDTEIQIRLYVWPQLSFRFVLYSEYVNIVFRDILFNIGIISCLFLFVFLCLFIVVNSPFTESADALYYELRLANLL